MKQISISQSLTIITMLGLSDSTILKKSASGAWDRVSLVIKGPHAM